jgi:hypothetical protein
MSGVVDVGDALELSFTTNTGATVTATWYDPDQFPLFEDQPVSEQPPGSGRFPKTFLPDRPGMWTAEFKASGAATANDRYFVRARSLAGPPPLASVGDVAEQFGTLSAAQEQLAAVLIRAASQMIRARRPSIDAQVAAGTVPADLVALAVTNMVLRVLRNPGGLRAETVGPFSRTYDVTYAAGLLVLSPDEESLLNPVVQPGATVKGPVRMLQAQAPLGIAAVRRPGLPPDGWW